MRRLCLYGKNDLRFEEVERPAISQGEILVRVGAAAICGTDVRMLGYGTPNIPLVPGHEFAGTVEETKSGRFAVGQRVALQPNIGCGACEFCASGRQHMCPDYRAFGIQMDGAFAEYIKIPAEAVERGNVVELPERISFAEAAVVEPVSCAYNGFEKMNVHINDTAWIIGTGPIGLAHALFLHSAGARVAMSDLSEERLQQSVRLFPWITPMQGDVTAFVRKFTGNRGFNVAIVACPSPEAQSQVLEQMAIGGRVNFFGGIPAAKEPVALDTNLIHYREICVTGSARSSLSQYRKVLKMAAEKTIDVSSLVTHTYSLEQYQTAFDNARNAVGIKHIFIFE